MNNEPQSLLELMLEATPKRTSIRPAPIRRAKREKQPDNFLELDFDAKPVVSQSAPQTAASLDEGRETVPEDKQRQIMAGLDLQARREIAAEPSLLLEFQATFAHSKIAADRAAVATNPKLQDYLVTFLLKDARPEVREGIAETQNLDEVTQLAIAKGRDEGLTVALAYNPHVSSRTQDILFQDKRDSVLTGLAYNPCTKPEIVEKMADHPSPVFLDMLITDPELPAEKQASVLGRCQKAGDEKLGTFAANPGLSDETQIALAKGKSTGALYTLSVNPTIREPAQITLIDKQWGNLKAMAGLAINEATTDLNKARLFAHQDVAVRGNLAVNSSTQPELLEKMMAKETARAAKGEKYGADMGNLINERLGRPQDLVAAPTNQRETKILKAIFEAGDTAVEREVCDEQPSATPAEPRNRLAAILAKAHVGAESRANSQPKVGMRI